MSRGLIIQNLIYISYTNVGGTKVVRYGFYAPAVGFFRGVQNKSVQSIIGATEKRRESAVGGVSAGAELSGIGFYLFDGGRKGVGRNSVAVPSLGSVGCNAQ